MSGVIISPWWFYLINVANGIKVLCVILATISFTFLSVFAAHECFVEGNSLFDPYGVLERLKDLENLTESDLKQYSVHRIECILDRVETITKYIKKNEFTVKWFKIIAIIGIISVLLGILIPSKEIIIEMLLASNATYENVGAAFEGIKNAADYIIGAIKK